MLACYAFNLVAFPRHLGSAERFAQAALEWNERVAHPLYGSRTEFLVYAYIYSWTRARRSLLEPLRKIAEQCREAGDLEYAYYACSQRAYHESLAGEPLARVASEYEAIAKQGVSERIFPNVQPRILRLLQRSLPDAHLLAVEISEIEQVLDSTQNSRMNRWVFWLEVLCLIGCYEEAFGTSERIASWICDVGATSSQVVDFTFFRSVIAAERAQRSRGLVRRRHVRVLRRGLRRLRIWARYSPDFVHMTPALQAERARLRRRPQQALTFYARSIARATQQSYRHHAAFLHERRAQLLLELNRSTEAAAALRQAIALYEEWGAAGKAQTLRHGFGKLSG
jgi:hypothetical protein